MNGPGLTVLLVDDSMVIRRVLSQLLRRDERIGRVFEAGDAAEGYSLFKICKPDAVVLDLELPDLHGLEVLKSMKSADSSAIVAVLTTLDRPEIRDECLRLGADAFFTKEPGLWQVADTIAELCRRPDSRNGSATRRKRTSKTIQKES